jgi:hypothetical protein
MFHKILSENNYALAQFIDDTDQELHNALTLHFIDTDSSGFSNNGYSDKDEKASVGGGSANPKS